MRRIALSKRNIWILIAYGIGFVLYLHFSLTSLTASIISEEPFPSFSFIALLVLFLITNLIIGLGVRRYIKNFKEGTKSTIRTLFIGMTLFGFIVNLLVISIV